jgi:NAD-dependent deacetylase
MTVASIDGWRQNPELVTQFYNQRRAQLATAEPNAGHHALKHLESAYETIIITQNVDNLHERAGSKMVLHLHGELTKMRSSVFEQDVYEVGYEVQEHGKLCPRGTLLRPHIVWFGEEVPMMNKAIELVKKADIFIVVGTSLEVYPAAGLIHYAPAGSRKYLIDPNLNDALKLQGLRVIQSTAAKALPVLVNKLLSEI